MKILKISSVKLDLGEDLDFQIEQLAGGVTCLWRNGRLVGLLVLIEDEVEEVMEEMGEMVRGFSD